MRTHRLFSRASVLRLGLVALLLAVNPLPTVAKGVAKVRVTETFREMGPCKVGEQMPTWAGHTAKGQTVRSQDLIRPRRGDVPQALVISFFGTYCAPCKIGLPIIQKVMDENPTYKTVLIAKPPKLNLVTPFLKNLGVRQLVVEDEHEKIAGRLGVGKKVPRTIVVGRDGVVRAIFGIEGVNFKQQLEAALQEAESKARIKK